MSKQIYLYDISSSAETIYETAKEVLETRYPTLQSVEKAIALLNAARVLLINYENAVADMESEQRALKAAEAAKAAKQLEESSAEVFGA
jgi:hypothetical protein